MRHRKQVWSFFSGLLLLGTATSSAIAQSGKWTQDQIDKCYATSSAGEHGKWVQFLFSKMQETNNNVPELENRKINAQIDYYAALRDYIMNECFRSEEWNSRKPERPHIAAPVQPLAYNDPRWNTAGANTGGTASTPTLVEHVQLKSVNVAGAFLRHRNGVAVLTPVVSELDKKDSSFIIRSGLAGPQGISFESVNFPGAFLRHSNFRIRLDQSQPSELFKKDATFRRIPGISGKGLSFESINFPGFYIRQCNNMIFLDNAKGNNKSCIADLHVAMNDASFEVVASQPVTQAPASQPVTQAPASQPVTQAPASKPVTQAPASKPKYVLSIVSGDKQTVQRQGRDLPGGVAWFEPLTVVLKDQAGTPVEWIKVSFNCGNIPRNMKCQLDPMGGGVSGWSNPQGMRTADKLFSQGASKGVMAYYATGKMPIVVSADGADSITFDLTVTDPGQQPAVSATGATMVIMSGNGQKVALGVKPHPAMPASANFKPLQVVVKDGAGKPLSGVNVTFTCRTVSPMVCQLDPVGSGPAIATTNMDGVATLSQRGIGYSASAYFNTGPFTIVATYGPASATFNLTVEPAVGTK